MIRLPFPSEENFPPWNETFIHLNCVQSFPERCGTVSRNVLECSFMRYL